MIELLVVLLLISLLAGLVAPVVTKSLENAKQAALKENLQVFRKAIDDYYIDKGNYPENLEILVDQHYLKKIPVSPYTGTVKSWQLIYSANGRGIKDILHSESVQ